MNNAPAILKTLIIYALIVPLAIFFGYLLTNPLDYTTFGYTGILMAILLFPLLLRWHHPMLIFCWNSSMCVVFLPGRPEWWLVMTAASLGITLVQRALGGVKHLLSVPQVTWSLVCMAGVVVLTANLTGLGFHTMGAEASGGRRYVAMLGTIMFYFALSTRRIPPERAHLYIGLFYLSGLLAIIGDLWSVIPEPLDFIYWIFPTSRSTILSNPFEQSTRFVGGSWVAFSVFGYMQARYGIRGIFLSGKSWRWLILAIAFGYGLLGGFRYVIATIVLTFVVQFFVEGLHRTRLLPIFAALGFLMAILLIPLAPHLPRTAQRTLSFLPLNIDNAVRQDAETSTHWRLDMWKALLPQIPQHLLVGKGYAISRNDIDTLTGTDRAMRTFKGFDENQYMALSGTYHNGPLSVVMTFGIWGVITMIWFWIASVWVLHRNYLHGNPALRTVNTFLWCAFVVKIIFFLLQGGDIAVDMLNFGGWLGLSVALNGGVCQPAPAPAPAANKYPAFDNVRAHLQPTFRRPNARV
jgi:hypothetical protein